MKNFLILLLLFLVSCGGNTPEPTPETFSIQITPGAALLTKTGETKALTAKVVNSSGNVVDKPITWISSNPEAVQISSDGMITALKDLGSSQITASSADLKSPPMLVMVAEPVDGAILVRDSQVVSQIELVNPNAGLLPDTEYYVVLKDIDTPVPGSVLLGIEERAVGGQVISSEVVANGIKVRLKILSVPEMLKRGAIEQKLDYSKAPLQIPETIRSNYDVREVNGEYQFTPKANASFSNSAPNTRAVKPFNLGPFECDLLYPDLPVTLSALPSFSVKFDPTVDFSMPSTSNFQHLILRGSPKVKMSLPLTLNLEALVGAECKVKLFSKDIPLPGFLVWLSNTFEFAFCFDLSGKLTVAKMGLLNETEIVANVEVGIARNEADQLRPVGSFEFNSEKSYWKTQLITPNPLGDSRLELSISPYFQLKHRFGITAVDSAKIDTVTAKVGFKYDANLALPSVQIQPQTPDYKSDYKFGLFGEIGISRKNLADESNCDLTTPDFCIAKNGILNKLGIYQFAPFKISSLVAIGVSPVSTELNAIRSEFAIAGKTTQFRIKLDPKKVRIFTLSGNDGLYNVDKIVIYIKGSKLERVLEIPAVEGQIDWTYNWVIPNSDYTASTMEYYAFVETKFPSLVPLELGKINIQALKLEPNDLTTIPLDSTYQFKAKLGETPLPSDQVIWSVEGGTISSSGLYKGTKEGIFAVKATLKDAPDLFVEGSVKVTKEPGCVPRANEKYCVKIFDAGLGRTGLNNKGQLFSSYSNESGLGTSILWENDQKINISNDFFAIDINNTGRIVGYKYEKMTGGWSVQVWHDGKFTILKPNLFGNFISIQINDQNQVLGSYLEAGNKIIYHILIWDSLTGNLIGDSNIFFGTAFNNAGKIVGFQEPFNDIPSDMFFGTLSTFSSLPIINSNNLFISAPTAVNDSDQILVFNRERFNTQFGSSLYILTNGAYIKIDPPTGSTSYSKSLNNAGQVAGYYYNSVNSKQKGFIWQNKVATDLNTLIDPTLNITIIDAQEINDKGQIAALCVVPNTNNYKTCLMTPAQ